MDANDYISPPPTLPRDSGGEQRKIYKLYFVYDLREQRTPVVNNNSVVVTDT